MLKKMSLLLEKCYQECSGPLHFRGILAECQTSKHLIKVFLAMLLWKIYIFFLKIRPKWEAYELVLEKALSKNDKWSYDINFLCGTIWWSYQMSFHTQHWVPLRDTLTRWVKRTGFLVSWTIEMILQCIGSFKCGFSKRHMFKWPLFALSTYELYATFEAILNIQICAL